MDRVRKLIEAQAAYRLSLYGEGVGVAVVDSGINDRHPDLKGRVFYSYITLQIPVTRRMPAVTGLTSAELSEERERHPAAGTRDLRRGAILFP